MNKKFHHQGRINFKYICYAYRLISLILCLCFMMGCVTSVKREPFKKFLESTESLKIGTANSIDLLIPQTISRYKKELLEELKSKQSDELYSSARLKLVDDSPFIFEEVPRYMTFDQFKVGLQSMTATLYSYSSLLLGFANKEIQNDEEFKKLAEELNANSFETLRTLNKLVDNNSANNIGILSSIAATAFNKYLQNKQKEILVDAIKQNQLSIETYIEKIKQAISIIAVASNQEYLDTSKEYMARMLEPNKSSNAIDALIKINREHFAQIQSLKLLNEAIGKIPDAHKELINAANNPNQSLVHIIELSNRGNQLKAMLESAKKNKYKYSSRS